MLRGNFRGLNGEPGPAPGGAILTGQLDLIIPIDL